MSGVVTKRRGLVGGVVGLVAAGAGAVLVADRKVTQQRRRAAGSEAAFAPAAPTRSGFVGADDGVPLFYEQLGPDDAPVTVVFAHGFCLDHDIFVLQQRALEQAFGPQVRRIAYDHRSHGRSGRSDAGQATVEQLGSDLRSIIDALAPDGPLVLVGHSMGGMTVMALADAHPELFGPKGRVKGVLLASTSPGKLAAVTLGLPAVIARLKDPVMPLLLGGARRGTRVVERSRARLTDVAWVFVKRLSFGPDVDPAIVELVTTTIGRTGVDVIADFFPALMRHDKLDALEHLAGTPVVIVAGADDVITPLGHSREIAAAVPHARLVTVPATGHLALLERPEAVDDPLAELVEGALAARPKRRRRAAS